MINMKKSRISIVRDNYFPSTEERWITIFLSLSNRKALYDKSHSNFLS